MAYKCDMLFAILVKIKIAEIVAERTLEYRLNGRRGRRLREQFDAKCRPVGAPFGMRLIGERDGQLAEWGIVMGGAELWKN